MAAFRKIPSVSVERGNLFGGSNVYIGMDSPIQVGGLIRILRGRKVILDRDLARLYGVATKTLNRAVSRNIERFPDDFLIRLADPEWEILKSQIGTSRWGGDRRALPLAFTEQGVAMLSSVLKSPQAIQVNIAIMRAFVTLREAVMANEELGRRLAEIEGILANHESRFGEHAHLIQEGFEAIRKLMEAPEPPRNRIGFGQ